MIAIIDYGMGNLHSVSKALERLGFDYFISGVPAELAKADALLLPGVGSFKDAMESLHQSGLTTFIQGWAVSEKPLLGICLGMQLLFEESEENGQSLGLALLPGKVQRFSGETEAGYSYKVPHMGWNNLNIKDTDHALFQALEGAEGYVYFVHSYVVHADNEEDVLATSSYYGEVPAVVGRGSVLGMQFHPEKSSAVGMRLLQNFGEMVQKAGVGR
ncbi:imidazole glycerol phosphate synthase subunit HisH [Bacillus horti]|uniref:Imidazole glycerol phosphate synthase subunit HisH n=1 Tax=Caldalkalibacillus horti TaxID=77523 RepID=A0ABT9W3J6_9BACI|nr:imidazole glycerol phosphate synthase subunit HisH [Bacillus horti]MDQ0167690.1 glutamine amidotransferase [Bacillus horti]